MFLDFPSQLKSNQWTRPNLFTNIHTSAILEYFSPNNGSTNPELFAKVTTTNRKTRRQSRGHVTSYEEIPMPALKTIHLKLLTIRRKSKIIQT